MYNNLIEEYIEDNIHFDCKKEYLSSYIVRLEDRTGVLSICQLGDDLDIYIDDEYLYSVHKSFDKYDNYKRIWPIHKKS